MSEEDFIQLYRDKFYKEPQTGDFDRFIDRFLKEVDDEYINTRLYSEVSIALNFMNEDDEEEENEDEDEEDKENEEQL